jgi:hypothetical protein
MNRRCTMSFDDREVELLVLALRFWRAHRRDGVMRCSDPFVASHTVDALLAKLGSRNPPTMTPDDPSDSLDELFARS